MFWHDFHLFERLLAPHLCPICDAEVTAPGLCLTCWPQLTLITDNTCHRCGLPFDTPVMMPICGDCHIQPPDFDHAVSSLVYADPARQMILGFKHGDRQEMAPILAKIMAPKTLPLIETVDFVLPLPLHRLRFFRSRFNQSTELARHLTKAAGLFGKFDTRLLIRHKATPPQGRKTKAQRITAMRGAFQVPKDQHQRLAGKHILLIDDVLTTGASLSSAARCLKRNGAKQVSVSTLARVC